MPAPTTTEALARLAIFARLDAVQLAQVADGARRHPLARGELLFTRGTASHGFYGVISGLVQLSVANAGGAEKVLEIIGPGQSLGEAVLFLRRPFPVDATALVDSEVLLVPAAVVDRLLDSDPSFARAMLASMAVRLHERVHDIEMVTLATVGQRVAGFLLGELRHAPAHGAGPATVTLPATKQVLASRLGMTPATFSRALRDLADRGLIAVDGRRIRIPDADALASG